RCMVGGPLPPRNRADHPGAAGTAAETSDVDPPHQLLPSVANHGRELVTNLVQQLTPCLSQRVTRGGALRSSVLEAAKGPIHMAPDFVAVRFQLSPDALRR